MIQYAHMPGLGGLRHPRSDSPNTGWRNTSFRGYADHMRSSQFQDDLAQCIAAAELERIALMCAEAVPWRCHRSLIADALIVRGVEVAEIASATSVRPHKLTSWALVEGTEITYPAQP